VLVWYSSLHATDDKIMKKASALVARQQKQSASCAKAKLPLSMDFGGHDPQTLRRLDDPKAVESESKAGEPLPGSGAPGPSRSGSGSGCGVNEVRAQVRGEDEDSRVRTLAASLASIRAAAKGTRWEDCEMPPWFEVPVHAAMNGGRWVYHGSTSHVIDAHACELPENGADAAHLGCLHKDFVFPAVGWLVEHGWDAQWQGEAATSKALKTKTAETGEGSRPGAGPTHCRELESRLTTDEGINSGPAITISAERSRKEWSSDLPTDGTTPAPSDAKGRPGGPTCGPFRSTISIDESMRVVPWLGGMRLPFGNVTVEVQQCGPAVVFLKMQTDMGPLVVVETVLSVAPLKQHVRHSLFAPTSIPRLFCRFVLDATAR